MPIAFTCPSCGKRYKVADDLAGRRAKCKQCLSPMQIPAPGDEQADSDALGDLESAAVSAPTVQTETVARASVAHPSAPVIEQWLAMLDRYRPRDWWAWALAAVVLLLILGLINDLAAMGCAALLGGAGGLLLAAAIVWGVMIGIAVGSRVIVAALVAAPALVIVAAIRKAIRGANSAANNPHTVELSFGQIAMTIGIAFALIATIAALLTHPRKFKRPLGLGGVGALLLAICWIPMFYRAQGATAAPPTRFAQRQPGMPQNQPPGALPPRTSPSRNRTPSASPPQHPVSPAAPGPTAGPTRPPATSPTVPTSAPSAAPRAPGQRVQAKWGGTWYDATVLRQERNWTHVRYSDQTIEWVEPWRIREVGSTADDIPPVSPNKTYNKPDAPAPPEPPGPKPLR